MYDAAKEERLKERCVNTDKYKGKHAPRCNGGNPCKMCVEKYRIEQARFVWILTH